MSVYEPNDANCPPPAVLASAVPGSTPCSGCGAALAPTGSAVDYRDALCGRFSDSQHRIAPLDRIEAAAVAALGGPDGVEATRKAMLEFTVGRANDPTVTLSCAEERMLIDAGLAKYDALGMVWL